MGIARLAPVLVVVASIFAGAAQGLAIELGELQAMPSNAPPYRFRLPIITPLPGPAAAVTVRHPPDALAFVKQNAVELRLHSLTEIELEVSHGGQTLNRLLLQRELLAARTRLETVPASNPSQPARAKGRDRPLPEASPPAPAPKGADDRTLLDREVDGIRQEIHRLVGRVAPWEGPPSPSGAIGEGTVTPAMTLMLGGFCIAGIGSLVTGYVLQHHVINRQRRRRRALTVSIRRMQDQLAAGVPALPAALPPRLSRAAREALEPVAVMPRIRVSRKTRRRFRIRASRAAYDAAQEHDAEHVRRVARTSQRVPSAPADLLEALAQLRGELMRLQGRPPTSAAANSPDAGSGWTSR
jgi:hypothetical protein